MRITRDTMLKIAADAVARKTRASSDVLAAYLCGSLLGDDYLMGGAADIDLVFVHTEPAEVEREIVRLSEEVHLDIAHHFQRDYRDTRSLRVHPWLGPTLTNCRVMYDPQHFLDFTQASVRGQFDRSDYVFERARGQYDQARDLWLGLSVKEGECRPEDILVFLRSIEKSANSIATLTGFPLTERRFLAGFPERAEAVGRNGLYAGLLGLLGAPNLPPGALMEWFVHWRDAFLAVPAKAAPPRLHPDRLVYYTAGFTALLHSAQPLDVLWLLLYTWTLAILHLPPDSTHRHEWDAALGVLGLTGPAFAERVLALDAYLDGVDETLEAWARNNGAWESS